MNMRERIELLGILVGMIAYNLFLGFHRKLEVCKEFCIYDIRIEKNTL